MSAGRAVLAAGLAAGVLDILAALASSAARGVGPGRVLRYIASGVLGPAAFQGGTAIAALGLFLHFLIALGWAAVYWMASRRIAVLRTRPVISGLAYGVVVYFLMTRVVVPLSAVPPRPVAISPEAITIHMACVGLPIALVLARLRRT